MASLVVRVRVEHLASEAALWCEHCLLPSVISLTFGIFLNDRLAKVEARRECQDCGRA